MLEMAMLIVLTRKLAALAAERGAHAAWAGLGPLLWISGEVMGFVIAGLFGQTGLSAYVLALPVAAGGAMLSWAIVREAPISIVLPSDETQGVEGSGGAP